MRSMFRGSPVHAVLFYGPQGSGKSELARILTQYWICLNPSEAGPCDECSSCRTFERNRHVDVLDIEPGGLSYLLRLGQIVPVDGGNEEAVPLTTFFRSSAISGANKVAVLHDVHRMNADSANALLKTLEEPPKRTKLILTTDSVSRVLPTILSRCVAVACELPHHDELRSAFPDALDDEIAISAGSPGRLRHVLSRRKDFGAMIGFLRSLPGHSPGSSLVLADEFRGLCEAIGDKGAARAANAEGLLILADWLATSNSMGPKATHAAIEAHRRILQNGSASLVFDALFTRMMASRS
jgi:DNA polymerase-3 subunit delta'